MKHENCEMDDKLLMDSMFRTDGKIPMDSVPQANQESQSSDAPIRTAAYCRVSTDREEQDGSYDIQMDYFREKITSNPKMVLAGLYGDKGKSGLKLKGRIGLQQLMADCKVGKIDLILTKSVSRFARSMADCVELIQQLRSMKVTIFFEKESLRSTDVKCDLVLNILAAMAQEESHSISQNTIRSHEQYALEGRPYGRVAYGYELEGTTKWRINPQEARRVQCAFSMAAEGWNYQEILITLNHMEEAESTGIRWRQRRLKQLLSNPLYLGDYNSHATVCLTPGHQVVNRGYRDRYYIEEHHEPLVNKALFDRVQVLIKDGVLVSYMPMTPEKEAILRDESWNITA